jgi:hypothetical protein
MRPFREVADYQPMIIGEFERRGWLCEKYPGNGRPDLIATKHPYGIWCETKVIHTDSKKKRVIDHFTHAQIPTYLDFSKRSVLSGIYIAIAFVTDIGDTRMIEHKLYFVRNHEDVIILKDLDITSFRLGAFTCLSVSDMVGLMIKGGAK